MIFVLRFRLVCSEWYKRLVDFNAIHKITISNEIRPNSSGLSIKSVMRLKAICVHLFIRSFTYHHDNYYFFLVCLVCLSINKNAAYFVVNSLNRNLADFFKDVLLFWKRHIAVYRNLFLALMAKTIWIENFRDYVGKPINADKWDECRKTCTQTRIIIYNTKTTARKLFTQIFPHNKCAIIMTYLQNSRVRISACILYFAFIDVKRPPIRCPCESLRIDSSRWNSVIIW